MREIFLHTHGFLHFEKTEGSELTYSAIIENFHIEDVRVCIRITSDTLCEHTIQAIDTVMSKLEKMHSIAKQAYLNDFNDEEENVYIGNIYKKILSENEFLLVMQHVCIEQRLLFAVNLTSIDINIRNENTSTVFTYIKGYELAHRYRFNRDCEHTELIFQARTCIMKEQLSALIDIRELPLLNEICGRFRKDWQNYPLKSYFIYLMVRRIKSYLKTVMQ